MERLLRLNGFHAERAGTPNFHLGEFIVAIEIKINNSQRNDKSDYRRNMLKTVKNTHAQ
jgi:hypothetical protein